MQFRVSSNSGTYVQVSCIMAGLGAYPSSSKPRPGQGPTITPVKWTEGEEVISSQESNWSLDNKTVLEIHWIPLFTQISICSVFENPLVGLLL